MSTPPRRALVVDDSAPMRRSLLYALTRHGGFVCEEAVDGAEALQKLKAGGFDVVLVDINMPVMDGLKLLEAIRGDAALARLPVIVITTDKGQEDRDRALAKGATAYLTKPVQGARVLEVLKDVLDGKAGK